MVYPFQGVTHRVHGAKEVGHARIIPDPIRKVQIFPSIPKRIIVEVIIGVNHR